MERLTDDDERSAAKGDQADALSARSHVDLRALVRRLLAEPSTHRIEEMMQERGVFVDHVTVHRWSLKMLLVLAAVFRQRKRPVGASWRLDETYLKGAGRWQYLYRAVDRDGHTVDFLLTAKRDGAAARRFLEGAIALHDEPEKITIDKSGANTAAIVSYNADHETSIKLRQAKFLNNIV
jgi:putative transposase